MNSEWEDCAVLWPRRLIDGSKSSGPLMRRKVNGIWQYPRMTDETALAKARYPELTRESRHNARQQSWKGSH
jgi:hypothetical protein